MTRERVTELCLAVGDHVFVGRTMNGRDYRRASGLVFQECNHTHAEDYPHREYIAQTRGRPIYISLNLATGRITCGTKGYHFHRGTPPCV